MFCSVTQGSHFMKLHQYVSTPYVLTCKDSWLFCSYTIWYLLNDTLYFHKVRYRSNCLINHYWKLWKAWRLRSPRLKPRTRKNIFLPFPESSKIMQYRMKMDHKVSFLYLRLFKSASQFLLSLVTPILLLRDILNSIKSFTLESHWIDGHSLYVVYFKHGSISWTQNTFWVNVSTGQV